MVTEFVENKSLVVERIDSFEFTPFSGWSRACSKISRNVNRRKRRRLLTRIRNGRRPLPPQKPAPGVDSCWSEGPLTPTSLPTVSIDLGEFQSPLRPRARCIGPVPPFSLFRCAPPALSLAGVLAQIPLKSQPYRSPGTAEYSADTLGRPS